MRMQSLFYTIQINGFKTLLDGTFHATVDWTQLCKLTSEFISRSRSYKKVRIQDLYSTWKVHGTVPTDFSFHPLPTFLLVSVPSILTLRYFLSCGFCYATPQAGATNIFASPRCWIAWDTFWSDSSVIDRHRCMWGVQKNKNLQLWTGRLQGGLAENDQENVKSNDC